MLSGSTIEHRLREIIADVAQVPPESFSLDDELGRSGVDSLSMLRAIALIESELGIVVPDEEFAAVRTLRGLTAAVESRVIANAA